MKMDLNKKLKIDLHTHCYEATGYQPPTLDIVRRIVDAVKARNLDGIAITEHVDRFYGQQVKDIVGKYLLHLDHPPHSVVDSITN